MLSERLQQIVDSPKAQAIFKNAQEMEKIKAKYEVTEVDCDDFLTDKF